MDEIRALQKSRWNRIHANYERNELEYDNWLDLFANEIKNCTTPIIDLGCGSGNNTLYLVEKNKEVIPCDYTENAIDNIKKNFPEITRTECFDMIDGLPFPNDFTDVIIADLCLHYFLEKDTFNLLNEIKRVLKPNGSLMFRVNSINDVNSGAGTGLEIEKHVYQTDDMGYKRFFDESSLKYFLSDWEIICMQEETMLRYVKPKQLWKCLVRRKS